MNDYDEIVGIRFVGDQFDKLLFGLDAINLFKNIGHLKFQLIDRLVIKSMASMDLGKRWEIAAQYPTLFKRSDVERYEMENKNERSN